MLDRRRMALLVLGLGLFAACGPERSEGPQDAADPIGSSRSTLRTAADLADASHFAVYASNSIALMDRPWVQLASVENRSGAWSKRSPRRARPCGTPSLERASDPGGSRGSGRPPSRSRPSSPPGRCRRCRAPTPASRPWAPCMGRHTGCRPRRAGAAPSATRATSSDAARAIGSGAWAQGAREVTRYAVKAVGQDRARDRARFCPQIGHQIRAVSDPALVGLGLGLAGANRTAVALARERDAFVDVGQWKLHIERAQRDDRVDTGMHLTHEAHAGAMEGDDQRCIGLDEKVTFQ